MAVVRNAGLGKIQFSGTYAGTSNKWTENLAYTPINFGNPNPSQDATIDGSVEPGVDTEKAAADLLNICAGIASLTNGTFEDLSVRYDVKIYNTP